MRASEDINNINRQKTIGELNMSLLTVIQVMINLSGDFSDIAQVKVCLIWRGLICYGVKQDTTAGSSLNMVINRGEDPACRSPSRGRFVRHEPRNMGDKNSGA